MAHFPSFVQRVDAPFQALVDAADQSPNRRALRDAFRMTITTKHGGDISAFFGYLTSDRGKATGKLFELAIDGRIAGFFARAEGDAWAFVLTNPDAPVASALLTAAVVEATKAYANGESSLDPNTAAIFDAWGAEASITCDARHKRLFNV